MRYDCDVRFRLSVAVWIETESLADAQAAFSRVAIAAHAALGQAARTDEATGAWSHGEMTPADRAAADAFTAEDLGPGITNWGRTTQLPADERD